MRIVPVCGNSLSNVGNPDALPVKVLTALVSLISQRERGALTAAGSAIAVGVGVADGVGEALTTTFTPLLQTSFFPDLIQVYLYPLEIVVALALVQDPPALTAAEAVIEVELPINAITASHSKVFFISKL
jgi:hypothetical protein